MSDLDGNMTLIQKRLQTIDTRYCVWGGISGVTYRDLWCPCLLAGSMQKLHSDIDDYLDAVRANDLVSDINRISE